MQPSSMNNGLLCSSINRLLKMVQLLWFRNLSPMGINECEKRQRDWRLIQEALCTNTDHIAVVMDSSAKVGHDSLVCSAYPKNL